VSRSTVGRVRKRAGLSRLSDLEPSELIVRYEHERPGDLIYIDTKKLGRIERIGKRIPGSSHSPIKAGWEYLFVAIDDHARWFHRHVCRRGQSKRGAIPSEHRIYPFIRLSSAEFELRRG
jgi:hypothetical protein